MRRLILHICLWMVALAALPTTAWGQNDDRNAFFVYRNDGGFNAFFTDEVDSLVYERFVPDSTTQPDDWTHCAIYMPDSVCRIPLAAIDSISFTRPSTVYKQNVVRLDPLLPYLKQIDGMNLRFSASLPQRLQPKVGHVLIYEKFDDTLPNGFAGRVSQVSQEAGDLVYACDSASLNDIYDRLLWFGEFTVENDTIPEGRIVTRSKLVNPHLEGEGEISKRLALQFEKKFGEEEKKITVKAESYAEIQVRFLLSMKSGEEPYVNANVKLGIGGDLSLKGEIEGHKIWPFQSIPLYRAPVPQIPAIIIGINLSPVLELKGKAEIEASRGLELGVNFGATYQNGQWESYGFHYVNNKPLALDAKLEGSIFAGMATMIEIYPLTAFMSISNTVKCGLEFSSNLNLDWIKDNSNNSLYEDLADATLNADFVLKDEMEAKIKAFTYTNRLTKEVIKATFNINSWHLLPKFGLPTVKAERGNKATIAVVPSQKLLLPLTIGMGLYNENNECVDYEYCPEAYRLTDDWPLEKFEHTFAGLKPGHTYTCAPLVKFLGMELKATPAVEVAMPVQIETTTATDVTYEEATVGGKVNGLKQLFDELTTFGFVYSDVVAVPNLDNGSLQARGKMQPDDAFKATLGNLSEGTTYYYRAYIVINEQAYYGNVLTFTTPTKPVEAVDLGLSVLWAKWNVGATSENQPGNLLGWGDATGNLTTFDVVDDNYNWTSPLYGGPRPPANIANSSLDIAHVRWGGTWRMPTQTEMVELIDKCTWEWTFVEGTPGMLVTGPSGESIFLPAAGYRFGTSVTDDPSSGEPEVGFYWTATHNTEQPHNAYRLAIGPGRYNWSSYARYAGHLIRPVMPHPQIPGIEEYEAD